MESPFLHCTEILSEEEEDQEMQQENGGDEDAGDDDDGSGGDDDDASSDDGSDDEDGGDEDENAIRILIGQENAVARLNNEEIEELVNDNWIREIRTPEIRYIRRTGRQFRLSRRTLYRAVIYLDRFLARRIIANGELGVVRLLTVTCLSLSTNMDDNRDNVLPLEYYNINVNAIRRMELLVLNEFNWNMRCVTPFDFRNYFLSRFCRDVTRIDRTRRKTAVIIMSALKDMRLMNHRPYVIAAAATLLAVTINYTIEDLNVELDALPINGFLQLGIVSDCYFTLLDLNI